MLWRTDNTNQLTLGRTGKFGFFPKFKIDAGVRKFHTYVVGLTGRGKSKFMQNLIVQDIVAGRGCAVIDPHGDLAKDVLRTLIAGNHFRSDEIYKRFVYISPRRRDHILPFNVLAKGKEDLETYEIAQRVISAFQRTWAHSLKEPPRFQQIMRSSLATLIETEQTLCDLYKLLTNDDYRTQLLDAIQDEKVAADCKAFFENEFERWGRDRAIMIGSTTNKISALTDNPNIYYMLGQKGNQIDIREIMDAGKVLLVDLGECDHETKRLFGTLIVTGFEQAALSRARSPIESRTPFYLYVDEFQDFACHPGSAETFSQMLSQVRKFGLHMILANQSIAQLTPQLQTALGNAQTIVSFRISRADAEALARVLGNVDLEAIKRQSQTDVQHPIYASLAEQWEGFIQNLTRLQVRQTIIKTADDRYATVWPEKVSTKHVDDAELEAVLTNIMKNTGIKFDSIKNSLSSPGIQIPKANNLYDY